MPFVNVACWPLLGVPFELLVCLLASGLAKLLPGTPEEIDAAMKESIPLKRVGRKWDIAMAAVFLSSPAAAYMTGKALKPYYSSPEAFGFCLFTGQALNPTNCVSRFSLTLTRAQGYSSCLAMPCDVLGSYEVVTSPN